ncbi:hypothetical protein CYMTET_17709 [Cymbomonas tetramitiformis]|uniref:Uncharacterized protein n=1 Tax=Cymbomonas tetramitiformis TaxID=36881 RepID=A0AAE0G9E1_9CHLO|nr:hypothetical protein CYMTET_17709 [Cymbomonas tetramitiformis]
MGPMTEDDVSVEQIIVAISPTSSVAGSVSSKRSSSSRPPSLQITPQKLSMLPTTPQTLAKLLEPQAFSPNLQARTAVNPELSAYKIAVFWEVWKHGVETTRRQLQVAVEAASRRRQRHSLHQWKQCARQQRQRGLAAALARKWYLYRVSPRHLLHHWWEWHTEKQQRLQIAYNTLKLKLGFLDAHTAGSPTDLRRYFVRWVRHAQVRRLLPSAQAVPILYPGAPLPAIQLAVEGLQLASAMPMQRWWQIQWEWHSRDAEHRLSSPRSQALCRGYEAWILHMVELQQRLQVHSP